MESTKDKIFAALEAEHPDAKCELNYRTPFELLVAVILSAQCTDKRVNLVTKDLFEVASTPEDFVKMPIAELEERIRSCGFYHNKAKSIKSMAESVLSLGGVPETREDLMKLSGVGRKTANVVYSVAFGGNAIAVDTHVFRVSNRIGLVNADTPEKVEDGLTALFEEEKWGKLHHLLIFHGRYVCTAKSPKCEECSLKEWCKYYKNNQN